MPATPPPPEFWHFAAYQRIVRGEDVFVPGGSGRGRYALWCVLSGRVEASCGQWRAWAETGEAVIALPGAEVAVAGCGETAAVAVTEFSGEALRGILGRDLPQGTLAALRHRCVVRAGARLGELMGRLAEAMDARGPLASVRRRSLLGLVLAEAFGGVWAEEAEGDDDGVLRRHFRRFEALAEAHVPGERRVGWYAGELCLSPQYLSEAVRLVTGHGARRYLDECLARKAGELLRASELTVQQVADVAGFADQASFAKFFRRMTGMTPTDWRSGSNPFPF